MIMKVMNRTQLVKLAALGSFLNHGPMNVFAMEANPKSEVAKDVNTRNGQTPCHRRRN